MDKILVVEDSPMVVKIIRHLINQDQELEVVSREDFAGCREAIENDAAYFAAVVDLNLPDAPNGEVVELVLEHNIPAIVLTGTYDDERRERLLNLGVVDYVVKESRQSYEYVFHLLERLRKNRHIKVLVADDSSTTRRLLKDLLTQHLYQVVEAQDGHQALQLLDEHTDIKVLITDYAMPMLDGFELVKRVRTSKDKQELVVIGLSSSESASLSAKFIKNGANDFLRKPLFHEEFHCRLMHNLESLEMIEKIQDAANRDYLTGLFNRRYFFERGAHHYNSAKQGGQLALALLDVDHFKHINDTYSHEAGDELLREFAKRMEEAFPRFVCSRMGGEEFCILMPGLNNQQAFTLVDGFRALFAKEPFYFQNEDINITFSGGVTNLLNQSLDAMLKTADEYLYRAKEAGRNFIICDD